MSFKDVRDLAEHLKLLGFPNMFPLQALATPNGSLASFHIVAEVLQWLAGLMEPGNVLPGGVATEEQRVLLIRSATEFFVTKSAIKLNPRKLYVASAVTAGELQKITRLLIAPTQTAADKDEEEHYRSLNQIDIGDKMDDLRRARELSTELTQRGATLYDLLVKEAANKEARAAANRPMELASVERTLKNAIAAAQLKLQGGRAQLEGARVEMNAMSSKLQRKRAELERTKQRLEALQKIRPAHMQEFEECEKELQDLFQQYFQRIHVRDALRAQLEARTRRATSTPSPVLQKPAESSMPFITEGLHAGDDDEDDDPDDDDIDDPLLDAAGAAAVPRDERARGAGKRKGDARAGTTSQRPGTATSRVRPITGRSRRGGGLTGRSRLGADERGAKGGSGAAAADDDSSFGSSDSDLDMEGILGMGGMENGAVLKGANMLGHMGNEMGGVGAVDDDDDDDDDFGMNSMDDISISKMAGEMPLRPKTAGKAEHHSDEDF